MAILLLPAGLAFGVFFLVPLALLVEISLGGSTAFSGYAEFFGSAGALRVLLHTIVIAGCVTLACILLAVPFCLALRQLPPAAADLVLLAATLPMWINILVRSYAWITILSQEGVANAAAAWLHLGGAPYDMLYDWGAVGIGMVHILLPYMLLPVQSAMRAVDPQWLGAARSLGAGPWRRFATIILPLIAPGIATGAALVFVLSVGFYVTPEMLGGPRDMMLASYIYVLINTILDFPGGAAASVILVLAVVCGAGLILAAGGRRAR